VGKFGDGIEAAPGVAFVSDPGTGIFIPAPNRVALSTNQIQSVEYTENLGGIIRRDHIDAGLTASPIQSQGNGLLLSSINEITNVQNSLDTVTMVAGNPGAIQEIINNGTNVLQIFPNVGYQIELSPVNAPITLPLGGRITLRLISATKWLKISESIGDIVFLPSDLPNLVHQHGYHCHWCRRLTMG